MYRSMVINEMEKGWSSQSPQVLPSAPPLPPPPPPPVTGVPISSSTNQFNHISTFPPSTSATNTTELHQMHSTRPRDHKSHHPVPWSTGLCDCFDDFGTCCLTCWCPCVTFGRIAEIVDRGSTSCGASGVLYTMIMCLTGCSCMYSCFYRSKLRGQYFLEESPCTDCLVHCCCEECSLCQEYRQLKKLGYDLSIGWHGNVERKNRLAAMAGVPVVQPGMNR